MVNAISSELTPSCETIGVGSAAWPGGIVTESGSTTKFPRSELKSSILTAISSGPAFVRTRWRVTGGRGLPSVSFPSLLA